jgi:hypothetical protein
MSCIIVLGCYRSGTSAVAGILHRLGVVMGKEFDKPAKSNPKGYYEDLEFKRVFNMMPDNEGAEKLLDVLVRTREAEYDVWGVKDPQLCLLLHKFLPHVKKGHKIISTNRPKEEICDSLFRAIIPPVFSERPQTFSILVDHFLLKKEEALAAYDGPVLHVDWNELKSNPEGVEKIAEFVGVPVKQEAKDFLS